MPLLRLHSSLCCSPGRARGVGLTRWIRSAGRYVVVRPRAPSLPPRNALALALDCRTLSAHSNYLFIPTSTFPPTRAGLLRASPRQLPLFRSTSPPAAATHLASLPTSRCTPYPPLPAAATATTTPTTTRKATANACAGAPVPSTALPTTTKTLLPTSPFGAIPAILSTSSRTTRIRSQHD